jgi:hypothetical protein
MTTRCWRILRQPDSITKEEMMVVIHKRDRHEILAGALQFGSKSERVFKRAGRRCQTPAPSPLDMPLIVGTDPDNGDRNVTRQLRLPHLAFKIADPFVNDLASSAATAACWSTLARTCSSSRTGKRAYLAPHGIHSKQTEPD